MKIDEIEEKSEQIREILEKPPTNILKWGITIIFLIIFAMFLAAWVIKYPTVIPSQITITTHVPPHKIIAQSNGKITHLFVKENDVVKANQPIAIIENTAQFSDMEFIQKEISKNSDVLEKDSLQKFQFKDNLILGNVQTSYVNFKNAYEEFQEYQILLQSNKELQILNNQIKLNKEKLNNQSRQLKIYQDELNLIKKDFNRDETLFKKDIISAKEFEDKERSLLVAKRNYENIKDNKANTKITISNLEKEINTIIISKIESESKLYRNVKETYEQLKVSILFWKQKYLLISPIEGKISFFNFLTKNQYVNVGYEMLSIVPKSNNQIIGKMLMPVQNSGQVKQGQKVLIRLTAYPYQEYGMLVGKIKDISLLPSHDTYAVDVYLPFPLKTTFHKDIKLKSELSGNAEVVTEDLRLLKRVFYQIRKILNK